MLVELGVWSRAYFCYSCNVPMLVGRLPAVTTRRVVLLWRSRRTISSRITKFNSASLENFSNLAGAGSGHADTSVITLPVEDSRRLWVAIGQRRKLQQTIPKLIKNTFLCICTICNWFNLPLQIKIITLPGLIFQVTVILSHYTHLTLRLWLMLFHSTLKFHFQITKTLLREFHSYIMVWRTE